MTPEQKEATKRATEYAAGIQTSSKLYREGREDGFYHGFLAGLASKLEKDAEEIEALKAASGVMRSALYSIAHALSIGNAEDAERMAEHALLALKKADAALSRYSPKAANGNG